jgi:formate hydrogenlyase subunit 4
MGFVHISRNIKMFTTISHLVNLIKFVENIRKLATTISYHILSNLLSIIIQSFKAITPELSIGSLYKLQINTHSVIWKVGINVLQEYLPPS